MGQAANLTNLYQLERSAPPRSRVQKPKNNFADHYLFSSDVLRISGRARFVLVLAW
jgi:hypothetical protein